MIVLTQVREHHDSEQSPIYNSIAISKHVIAILHTPEAVNRLLCIFRRFHRKPICSQVLKVAQAHETAAKFQNFEEGKNAVAKKHVLQKTQNLT